MVKKINMVLLSFLVLFSTLAPYLPVFNQVSAAGNTRTVTATYSANPGYYWCQKSDGSWTSYSEENNNRTIPNSGGQPADTSTKFTDGMYSSARITPPPTSAWTFEGGTTKITEEGLTIADIKGIKIISAKLDDEFASPNLNPGKFGNFPKVVTGKTDIVEMRSDLGPDIETGFPSMKICGGNNGWIHPYPMIVPWTGEIEVPVCTIKVTPGEVTLTKGGEKQLKAELTWSDNPDTVYDITNSEKADWSSNSSAKVSVTQTGKVTGHQDTGGTAVTITIEFSSENGDCAKWVKVNVNESPPTTDSSIPGTVPFKNTPGDYLNRPVFQVGIMRDSGFYRNPDPTVDSDTKLFEAWKYRFPDNNDSILFTPAGYDAWFDSFQVGGYEPSTRSLMLYSDNVDDKVHHLQNRATVPANAVKDALSAYSLYGATARYTALQDGKWKDIGNGVSVAQARAHWDYILANQGYLTYGVQSRMKEVISPYADDFGERALTDAEVEENYRGYLALLINTWRLVPDESKMPWEEVIEDYIAYRFQGEGEKPSTIVVDTAMALKPDATDESIIIPSIDYFQFYTAIGTNWNIHELELNELYIKKFAQLIPKSDKLFIIYKPVF